MSDFVIFEIILNSEQIKADFLGNNMKLSSACKRGVYIHHIRVKTVARVSGNTAVLVQLVKVSVPLTETAEVVMFQHYTFRNAR